LKDAAAARQLVASDVPALPRGAPMPDAQAVRAFFEAAPPAPGKVSPGKVALGDGREVVFAVSRIIPGNPDEASAEQKLSLQQQMVQAIGEDDVLGLVDSLRARVKVTVAEDRL
jgi:peptidyl-prolyl cis-trans isomerase D